MTETGRMLSAREKTTHPGHKKQQGLIKPSKGRRLDRVSATANVKVSTGGHREGTDTDMDSKLIFQIFLLGIVCGIALAEDAECTAPMDQGTGDGQELRFYYNPEKESCSPFFYKGQGGNSNSFTSDNACMMSCSPNYKDLYPEGDAVCSLKMDKGTCFAMILMHYYDSEEKSCRAFLYSGCQGNGNRFESREECQKTCLARSGRLLNAGDSPNPDEQTTDLGLIVGILGGIVFAVAVVCAAVLLVQRKRKRGGMKKVPTNDAGTELAEVS